MSGEADTLGDPARHADLLRGMVQCAGVDLRDRAVDGRLDEPALGTLLGRCRQCRHANSCAAWLFDHEGQVADPPEYCLNRDRFAGMDHKP